MRSFKNEAQKHTQRSRLKCHKDNKYNSPFLLKTVINDMCVVPAEERRALKQFPQRRLQSLFWQQQGKKSLLPFAFFNAFLNAPELNEWLLLLLRSFCSKILGPRTVILRFWAHFLADRPKTQSRRHFIDGPVRVTVKLISTPSAIDKKVDDDDDDFFPENLFVSRQTHEQMPTIKGSFFASSLNNNHYFTSHRSIDILSSNLNKNVVT